MFWNRGFEGKLERINTLLQRSFSNVKNDTNNLSRWMQYLYQKSQEQEALIRKMNEELSRMPRTREDIRHIIDSYYSYDTVLGQIHRLSSRVDEIAQRQAHIPQPVQQVQPRAESEGAITEIDKRLRQLETKKLSLKERLIKRLTKNSKDYVKSVILSYIKKYESIPALQIKEMVVDDQALCSKSSFYRILEEVEEMNQVGIIKKGKEKHYFFKAIKNLD
ncbi:hypothetical protein HYT54_05220 [Candidatus Woesearchaeota archaeon]|nr:hypothetical protein [Candidatus Woesearchaeota archaeon]